MISRPRRSAVRSIHRAAQVLLWGVGTAGLALTAKAGGVITPYAAEDIEHNTNIFDLPKSGGTPVGKHGPTFADTFFDTRAGVEGTYLLDEQKFFGTAEFRHFDYDNFTDLNHNEELFDGGLKWKLARIVDGLFEFRHEQRIVQFQDLAASTQLILETENNVTASANVNLNPEWRLESLGRDHALSSPRNDVPGLSLHEYSIREGLKYLGVANLAAGVEVEYLEGKYNHDPLALNPNYHQITVAGAATYVVSGLTNFTGNLGYSRRADPSNAGLSGLTGSLGYQRSVTAKTSVNVLVSRALNTYVTTGGNEVDTSAGATVNYQATYKILVRAGYSYTDSKFPGTPNGAATIDRADHLQFATLDLTYQVLHWLSIRPYARYQTRHSNVEGFTFDGNVIGVELLAKQFRPNR
jgi:Putative beta-barrel porin 2